MNKVQNIAFLQLFANGDCLYGTAVAKQIKKDYPGCKLTWIIDEFCKNIIAGNPFIDKIIVTADVKKNDIVAYRSLKKRIYKEKSEGKWDEVFVATHMDTNLALYDGTVRGMVYRAYPHPITVHKTPVVVLSDEEIVEVTLFAETNNLKNFKNVILWEYAPQSGQSQLDFEFVMKVSLKITEDPGTCVVLTSGNKFTSNKNIIDASILTVKQNAALTHYCNLMIGSSSGITWINTSEAAKFLPMLQLLNYKTLFLNAPSVDFERFNIKHNGLIEMGTFTEQSITDCVTQILKTGFNSAQKYNQPIPLQFNTTRVIVYNLLVYGEFGAIRKHFKIMTSIYGLDLQFLKAFLGGFLNAPFKLVGNVWRKKIKK